MKKQAGFTLIELVIVIVILGILGAVAAPKFLNLQGDAYSANIKGLKGSIQSTMTMANTRAVLDGKDGDGVTGVTGYDDVEFSFGYPDAKTDATGILGALQDFDYSAYDESVSGAVLTLKPENRKTETTCYVKYTQAADKDTPAKVDLDTSGC